MVDADAGKWSNELHPASDRTQGKRLRDSRPFFRGLKRLLSGERQDRGIGVVSHISASPMDPFDAVSSIMKCGVPVTCCDAEVRFAAGDMLGYVDESRILKMLAGGMLLDAESAGILIDRGFGAAIGLRTREILDIEAYGTPTAEEVVHGGLCFVGEQVPVDSAGSDRYVCHRPVKECTVITEVLNEYGRAICPGLIWYENDLGGRVAILPVAGDPAVCFCGVNYPLRRRKALLYETLRWLGRGHVDMFVGGSVPVLPTRTDTPRGIILSVQNISSSTMFSLDVEVGRLPIRPTRLSRLDYAGWLNQIPEARLVEIGPSAVRICMVTNLPLYGLEVLVLN